LKKTGLYIHFPFCRRACFYCHFFKKTFAKDLSDHYIKYLIKEARLRKNDDLALDTVYVGGGSPSLISPGQLQLILNAMARYFRLASSVEITLEANPEDIGKQQLKAFQGLGVNRLSIGVQSFLKRTHSATQAELAVELAREAGFANISIDLIIGLESQTAKSMELNFRAIEKFKPAHISVYILEGVPRPISDDRDARLYFQARQALIDLGYEHYEVSNFCRPGKASQHNLKYWCNQPYVGIGASAAGYMDGIDYRNFSNLEKYHIALQSGKMPQARIGQMDPAKRRIITGLRLLDGIPASAFNLFSTSTDFLLSEGFLVRRGRNIAVPPEKILLLNEILGYFM
jgi:oxygen-independent coproporphyrinogen-3 oxidase